MIPSFVMLVYTEHSELAFVRPEDKKIHILHGTKTFCGKTYHESPVKFPDNENVDMYVKDVCQRCLISAKNYCSDDVQWFDFAGTMLLPTVEGWKEAV